MTEAAVAKEKFVLPYEPSFSPGCRAIAANKVGGGGALFAFQLQFEEFDCRALAASNEKMIAFHFQFGRRQRAIEPGRLPYLQILTAKF